jgi:LysR family hydrogen peroxide-inducible transcriptional activator
VLSAAGVVLKPVSASHASRCLRLVWRKSFPRPAAIEALFGVIVAHLPKGLRTVSRDHQAAAAQARAD